jgi:hypothetical protein
MIYLIPPKRQTKYRNGQTWTPVYSWSESASQELPKYFHETRQTTLETMVNVI